MNRARIMIALERCSECCLDVPLERERVADMVMELLRSDPAAQVVRKLFENAPTSGHRMEVAASHGKRLAALCDAAANLAGCP